MEQSEPSFSDLSAIFAFTYEQTVQQILLLAPKLIVAIALLLIGWLIASLLARASSSLISLTGKAITRFFPGYVQRQNLALRQTHHQLMSKIIFWLAMLFFIAAACNALGLNFFAKWIEEFFSYFPQFIAGIAIIVGGYMLSRVVKIMVVTTADTANFKQTELLGNSAQVAVFFTALVVGVEQLGINVQFLTQLFIAISAVLVAGFSLAFALGAKQLVENIIGIQQARRRFKIGDKIAIGDAEGILIEITTTALVLDSDDQTFNVPGHFFSELSSVTRSVAE